MGEKREERREETRRPKRYHATIQLIVEECLDHENPDGKKRGFVDQIIHYHDLPIPGVLAVECVMLKALEHMLELGFQSAELQGFAEQVKLLRKAGIGPDAKGGFG